MNLSGLSAVAGGYQEAQDQALQRQLARQRLAIEQQNQQIQQQQIQRQQEADSADARMAGGFGGLPGAVPTGGPPPVTGQQPMPGQSSLPAGPQPQMAGPGPQGPIPGAQPSPGGPPQPPPMIQPGQPQTAAAPQGGPAGGAIPVDPSSNPDAWFKNWGMQQKEAILAADPQAANDPKRFLADFHSRLEMLKQAEPFLKDRIEAVQKHIEQVHQAAVAQETQRHNKVDEGQAGARLGLEGQRIDIERQGKPEVLTDPAHKDAQGNDVPATQFVYNPMSRTATTLDGRPYTPVGAQKLGTGGGGGGRDATQMNSMTSAINETAGALKNLVELPISATTGLFQGAQTERGKSPAEGIRNSLAEHLTKDEADAVNVSFQGVARALATIEAAGRATGLVGLTLNSQGLAPQEGNSGITVLRKYAEIRQIAERGIESIKARSNADPQQVKLLEKGLEEIKQAVPWTVHDVNELQRGSKNDQTVRQFADKVRGAAADDGWKIEEVK